MNQPSAVQELDDARALAAVASQFWINGMIYAAVVPWLPDIRDRLSIDVSTLGLILTLSAVGGLAGSAVGGPAIIRLGTKRCIILGSIVTLAVLPVIGLTSSAIVVVLALGTLSLFDVIVDIGMNIQGSRLSALRATPVMNRLHGLWSLGTVVGGLIAVQAAGAGVPIWAHLAGVSLVLLVALSLSSRFLLSIDEAPSEPGDNGIGGPTGAEEPDVGGDESRRWLGYALLLALLGGAAVTMEMTTTDWAAFRLADDLGVAPGRVGLGFVAFTAGMVTGRFAGDMVQAALGMRRLVRYASVLAATGLVIATVLPTGSYENVGWLTPTMVTATGFYLAAVGVSVVFPYLYDAAAKAPGPAGRGLAALTAGTRIAGLSAPIIVGFVADTSLGVGTALALVTLPCCAISFLVPLSIEE